MKSSLLNSSWIRRVYPDAIWELPGEEDTVYVTFDDGPHPVITPWVIDRLNQFNFTGTFFCIGNNVSKHLDVYQQIIDDGHSVGNHTFNHMNGWKQPADEYMADIQKAASIIQSQLFRPPYGRLKKQQRLQVLESDYKIIMWSLLSLDYDPSLNASASLQYLKKHTKPGDIVVFHDSDKAFQNLKLILPEYLSFLFDQGYKCKGIEL